MRWLRDRIHGPRRVPPPEPAGEPPAPEPPAAEPEMPNFNHPRLVLLVHDAAGPASYQLHSFEDEAEAAAFVQFWFPGDIDHGVIAFWASHREPVVESGERPPEVVVLVRGDNRPKTVYPFSFSSIDLARAWVARESDRGLDPDHTLMYWAVPARIDRDHWGRVHVWPSEPPALRRETQTGGRQSRAYQRPVQPPPPFEPWAPKRREAPHQEPPARQVPQPSAPLPDPSAWQPEPALDPQAPAPAGPPLAAPVPPDAEEPAPPREKPPEPPAEDSAAAEDEPLNLPFQAPRREPQAKKTPPPLLKPKPGRKRLPLDSADAIEKLRGPSRWQQREGPFRGFGSPPGKF